jgi:hypothetical protein
MIQVVTATSRAQSTQLFVRIIYQEAPRPKGAEKGFLKIDKLAVDGLRFKS